MTKLNEWGSKTEGTLSTGDCKERYQDDERSWETE